MEVVLTRTLPYLVLEKLSTQTVVVCMAAPHRRCSLHFKCRPYDLQCHMCVTDFALQMSRFGRVIVIANGEVVHRLGKVHGTRGKVSWWTRTLRLLEERYKL